MSTREFSSHHSIKEKDVFVLNPLYRLRSEKNHIFLYGSQGLENLRLHRSYGIVLALCNGENSVIDIARLTRPFVKNENDEEAIKIACSKVKCVICSMFKLKEDKEEVQNLVGPIKSGAILFSKEEYLRKYGHKRIFRIHYDAKKMLPKDVSEISSGPYNILHERSPSMIGWHLTSECSTNCKYCYLGRRNVSSLPIERVLTLIQEAVDIGVFSIDPSGGDVLLYPELIQVLEKLHHHQFLPFVFATKSYLSKEKAQAIGNYLEILHELQFSIDSTVDDVADYLVGSKIFCQRIFSSIENALEAGIVVTAKAVVTPYNILTIPKLYRDLKKRGVSTIRLAAYSRSGFHHTDSLFNHQETCEWLDVEMDKLKEEFPDDYINLQNGFPSLSPTPKERLKESWKNRSRCTAGRSVMMICADGKVIPCEQMPETEEYFCGDVSHQSIMEVWNGGRFKEMTYGMPREKFQSQPCYECEEREECHNVMGYCIRDLATHYGNIYQPPPNCYRHYLPFVRQT